MAQRKRKTIQERLGAVLHCLIGARHESGDGAGNENAA
jgi:hypothetical protein